MDLRIAEYIICIAENENLSRAAKKLYISHSALSQQLAKLEKELDCKIFYRNGNYMHPTKAGEIYLKAARACFDIKAKAYDEIHEMRHKDAKFTVGIPANRANNLFTKLLVRFGEKYDSNLVKLEELHIPELHRLIHEKKIDIMIGAQGEPDDSLGYMPLGKEYILLAVPDSHQLAKYGFISSGKPEKIKNLPKISLKEFEEEAFSLIHTISPIRKTVLEVLQRAEVAPKVIFEGSAYNCNNMVADGISIACLPSYILSNGAQKENVAYFLTNPVGEYDCVAAYRKDHIFTDAQKYFLTLVTELYNEDRLN